MRNTGINIPVLHLDKLSGIVKDRLHHPCFENDRADGATKLPLHAVPYEAGPKVWLRCGVQDDTCSSPFKVAEPRFLDEMLKSFDVESIDPVCIKKTSMSGNH
jgi:hypothetical protein